MSRAVVTLTEGGKGVGKSFRRGPHFLINDFLASGGGTVYTNLPVYRDLIARALHTRHGNPEDEYVVRIQVFPADVLKAWGDGESGPWEYFAEMPLSGCHIQIDEAHNYCGSHMPKAHIGRWVEWLGEVRHLAVTVEFISQHVMKMAAPVRREVAVKLYLKTTEDDRDPYFNIRISDWNELIASWTRRYDVFVVEEESRENRGKWEVTDARFFRRDPYYFELYDSHATPVKGGVKGKEQKREFEKRTRVGMFFWFVCRNILRLGSRLAVLAVIVWIFGFGGIGTIFSVAREQMSEVFLLSTADAEEVTAFGADRVPEGELALSPDPVPPPTPAPADPELATSPDDPRERSVETVTREALDSAVNRARVAEGRVASLEADLGVLRGELATANRNLADAIQTIDQAAAVTLLERDRVTFRNGFSFGIGEAIDTGKYRGMVIDAINWQRRTATLDDGTVLRIGGTPHDSPPGGLPIVRPAAVVAGDP